MSAAAGALRPRTASNGRPMRNAAIATVLRVRARDPPSRFWNGERSDEGTGLIMPAVEHKMRAVGKRNVGCDCLCLLSTHYRHKFFCYAPVTLGGCMRFHLPKPLHGWRQFAGEVGIIVLGVLIALGAQQLAENIHQRSEAASARRAVRSELETNMSRLASRAALKHCVELRMEEIQALLDGAAKNPSFVTPGWVGRPQYWSMQTVRWEAISQGGRAALLPADELADYGTLYSWMRNINGVMTTEQANWARLRTLEHMSSLTPQMIFELNATLQDARYSNWRIKRWMMQMQPTEAKLQLRNIPNVLAATRSACIPMATPSTEARRIQARIYGEEP